MRAIIHTAQPIYIGSNNLVQHYWLIVQRTYYDYGKNVTIL